MAAGELLPFHHQTSGLLFIEAKQAAKRAKDMSGRLGEATEAMTTVILCVVVAEAAINEIGEWFNFHHLRPPFKISSKLPREFAELELRTKWSLFPMIVRQSTFDQGSEPWQSFSALVDLRNYLVHLKKRPLPRSVVSLLAAKRLMKSDGGIGFNVASWAVDTVSNMFGRLTELLDLPDKWINLIWLWTPSHSFPPGLWTPGDPGPRPRLTRSNSV
jgi:hypothetical protein